MAHNFSELQQQLGVQFARPELLRQALTHSSFVNETEDVLADNERLEFLGDAVLDLVVADMLYQRFPDVPEGELTQMRAALVRMDSLAMLAEDLRLGEFLRIGKGEEATGGRSRPANLCRSFEALIGAMYLDGGMIMVNDFVTERLHQLLDYILENNLHIDARSELQVRSQAEMRVTPSYRVVDAFGPGHEKQYLVEVVIDNHTIGRGTGKSKRTAAQDAARAALQELELHGWPEAIPVTDGDTAHPDNPRSVEVNIGALSEDVSTTRRDE